MVQASGLDAAAWPAATWQLLHPLVLLLAAVCRRCEDAEAGRTLLALLLADQQVAGMLASAASHVLLHPDAPGGGSLAQRSRTAALQRDLLQLFAALAALTGRQPAVAMLSFGRESERARSRLSHPSSAYSDVGGGRDGSEAGPGYDLLLGQNLRRGLTRRRALQFFSFLVSPHSGLAQRVLDHDPSAGTQDQPSTATGRGKRQAGKQPAADSAPASTPASAANMRLRQSLLELLKAVFAAPGSPFVADKFVSDFYIRFHFIQFLKLYHNPQRDHQALFLCRQHMDTLLVLAGCKACPHIRHRFQQLSVVDFFVRELSLEFEAKQPTRGRMHRLSSSGSQLEHRRNSSTSTFGGLESGAASPALSLRLPGARDAEQRSPVPVPLLRLPSRGTLAAAVANNSGGSGSSSPTVPQAAGLPGGSRGLGVPRLNLGGAPSLPSPGALSTASPGNSARLGRPPLPPSARSGMGATPRLTSRLGRSVSARSFDGFAAPPPAIAPPAQQPPALRPAVPKLGLGGVGRSLAVTAAAGAAAAEHQAAASAAARQQRQPRPERAPSRVHFSPTPSRIGLPSDDSDSSGSNSSDDEDECAGPGQGNWGSSKLPADGVVLQTTSGRPTPPLGMDVPAGFTFTGDLEEDLDRLEALEEGQEGSDSEGEEYGGDSETASPTIPALRASPFCQEAQAEPPLLPRLDATAAVKTPLSSGRLLQSDRPADLQQQQQQQGGGAGAVPIPRLQLSPSMHSSLETRNAVSELQLAADAEAAKAKQGRGVLGELERSALGKGKVQAASVRKLRSAMSDVASVMGEDVSYSEERGRRLLYRDEGLHLEVLQLVFTLVFTPDGQLDPTYCDQYPWERKLQNIPFILYHHLNHEDNRPLLPHLLPRLAGVGAPALRLARLLCSALFRPEWYTGRCRISNAVGAYSTIYRASLPPWVGEGTVVLKLVDTPRHIQDRCAQVDVQGEVAILDALAGSPRACQMYDYGVDPAADAMFLVLKEYRCSLRQWRARQPASPAHHLRLYYAIFAEVAAAVGALLERGIVHFDLKCDNCLLEPLPGVSEADFWSPPSERPTFRVVLADFGESKAFGEGLDGATTSRARGTDCFKSPEMLLVGGASHNKEQSAYDRRRRQGAGPASDMWSLGCLLYELVTGQLLFCDSDWLQLVARVASPSMPLVTADKAAAVAGLPGMLDLLHFMLVRDARMRPTLADVQARLAAVRESTRALLPPHMCSDAAPPSSRGRPGGLQPSGGSQLFSPTTYVPSPKATMPMPLLAALPLTQQLVLAPLALLGSTSAMRQHPACRAVLLCSPAAACEAVHRSKEQRAAEAAAGGQSPASPGSASGASSSWDSPPGGSRRYYGANSGSLPRTTALTFAANPVFSPQGVDGFESPPAAGSPAVGQRLSVRGLTGTPRSRGSLRFSSAAIHPEPAAGSSPAAGEAAAGRATPSIRRVLLGSSPAKVHPNSSDGLQSCNDSGRDSSHQQQAQQQPAGVGLPVPPVGGVPSNVAAASAATAVAALGNSAQQGPAASSGSSIQRPEDRLLLAVLSDAELSAAAASCAAAGVECRLAVAQPAGSERGLHAPVALADWLRDTALPLVHGGSASGGLDVRPVLVAVQAGSEAEGAMLAVAHLMRYRQVSLYQAMVAASQWGIDLHLRQQHLLALQHWAAAGGWAA